MIRVYTASQTRHYETWIRLWSEWTEVQFTSSWPFMFSAGVPESPENASRFWYKDLQEVKGSDVVLVYAEPRDTLRGALIEAGCALGLGKRVICVGENPGFGTWQYHPSVFQVVDLEEARAVLTRWTFFFKEKRDAR